MQKKIIATIILLLALCFSGLTVHSDPLAEGKKKAREEDKAMVVYFFSKYCSYCEEMDRTVLGDKEINTILKRDLIYLRIDAEKNVETARKKGVRGSPTTVLIDSKGKRIEKIPGYIEKKRFKTILSYLKGKKYEATGTRVFMTTTEPQ